jgi:bifunctional isochorismate lyase/aryl carrier protein
MVHKEAYITPATLEARAAAWALELERAGVRRRPLALPGVRPALLVLDMQRYFLDPTSPAFLPAAPSVLPNVLRLIRGWRQAGWPVVLTRHALGEGEEPGIMGHWWRELPREGREEARLATELEAAAATGAEVLRKSRYSAFAGTGLAARLRERGLQAVVIAGVMTHLCCESTARDAFQQDFAVALVTDATASAREDLHLGSLRALGHGFAFLPTTAEALALLPRGSDA